MSDRELLQQALDALERVDLRSLVPDYGSGHYSVARLDGPQVKSAIDALRERLAQPEPEPVAWRRRAHTGVGWTNWRDYPSVDHDRSKADGRCEIQYAYTAPQPQAQPEPVAWVERDGELVWNDRVAAIGRNLYTAPPYRPWVDLTDHEIALIHADYPHPQGFARALGAAFRRRNGYSS